MSMDLDFWKYKKDAPRDDRRVYETACCDGQILEELETLPIPDILQRIAAAFSDWTVQGGHDYAQEGRGAFQISTTSQMVRFDCYGMQNSDLNTLIDVLNSFGCPLYDPQVGDRFDGWTDQ